MPNGIATQVSKPMGASTPSEARKPGRPKGTAKANRPHEIVFKGKLEASFKNATNLVKKLKGLQRDRHVRDSEQARSQYSAFLANLVSRIQECEPSSQVALETLVDWLTH